MRGEFDRQARGSRLGRIAAITLLFSVVVALEVSPAVGAGGSGAANERMGRFDVESKRRAAAAEIAQAKRAVEDRSRESSRRERRESRAAFRGLSRAAARQVIRDRVALLSVAPAPVVEEGVRAVTDTVGVVPAGPSGPGGVVESSEPLFSDADGGSRRPLDPTLTEGAGGFVPRRAATALRAPGSLAEALEFGRDGLELTVEGVDATGEVAEGRAFYANAAVDSDFLVQATATGAELFAVLRSEVSPERQRLRFELPLGLRLSRQPGGGVLITGADEAPVAAVSPPSAVDADGRPVPTTLVVEGDAIVVVTEHQGGDFAYPILVDPAIDDYRWASNTEHYGFGYDNGSWPSGTASPMQPFESGGLGIEMPVPQSYGTDDYAQWKIFAPGTAHIYRVDARDVWHSPYTPSCTTEELWSLNGTDGNGTRGGISFTAGTSSRPQPFTSCTTLAGETRTHCAGPSTACSSSYGTPANFFAQTLWLSNPAWATSKASNWFSGATVYYSDRDQPTHVLPNGPPKAVWKRSGTQSYTVSATDTGVGVKTLSWRSPSGSTETQTANCAGMHRNPCPATWLRWGPKFDATFTYDADSLTEGAHNFSATATDQAGRSTPQIYPVGVDRTQPDISLSGSLNEYRDRIFKSRTGQLIVDAKDGVPGGTDGQRRSGVDSIEIKINGVIQEPTTVQPKPQSCAYTRPDGSQATSSDSCPLRRVYNFDRDDGAHLIEIAVADAAGNVWRDSWTVITDVLDPVLLPLVHNPSPPTDWDDAHQADVTAKATDAGAGLHRIEFTEPTSPANTVRTARYQAPTGGDCQGTLASPCPTVGPPKTFSYSTANYREGLLDPALQAIDAADRKSESRTWRLKVDRSAPQVNPGGSAAPYENKAITTAGTYDFQILAKDGVRNGAPNEQRSGVASVELQLSKNEGAFQSVRTETNSACTGDSCEVSASYPIDTAALGDGLHTIKAIAKDRLYDRAPDPNQDPAQYKSRHISERIVKFYVDLQPPTLDAPIHNPPLPTGWVSEQALSTTVTARDSGTGVQSISLIKPTPSGNAIDSQATKNTQGTACTLSTDSDRRCPKVSPVTRFEYNTRDLAEGANVRPGLQARDAADRQSDPTDWPLKIDHTKPRLTLAGALSNQDGQTVDSDVYELSVEATDSNPETASLSVSGVRSVEVLVDGAGATSLPAPDCSSGSCPVDASLSYEFDGGQLAPGNHSITIRAHDLVGNRTEQVISVTVREADASGSEVLSPGDDGSSSDDAYGEPVPDNYCATPTSPDCVDDDGDNDAMQASLAEPGLAEYDEPDPDGTLSRIRRGGYGLGDGNPNFFDAPLFTDLRGEGLRRARLIVAWNVIRRGAGAASGSSAKDELDKAEAFMTRAKRDSVEVLVSFGRRRGPIVDNRMPTVAEYASAVRDFRVYFGRNSAFGPVTAFTQWNEPNERHQPTRGRNALPHTRGIPGAEWAGRFWARLRRDCRSPIEDPATGTRVADTCVPVAGDFLDNDSLGDGYFDGFIKGTRDNGNTVRPKIWAWHAYKDGDLQQTSRLRSFLRKIGNRRVDRVWLTEQGGFVVRPNGTTQTPAAANDDLQHILRVLPRVDTRISQLYVYQWQGTGAGANPFDTGLLAPGPDANANPRSMYSTFKDAIR